MENSSAISLGWDHGILGGGGGAQKQTVLCVQHPEHTNLRQTLPREGFGNTLRFICLLNEQPRVFFPAIFAVTLMKGSLLGSMNQRGAEPGTLLWVVLRSQSPTRKWGKPSSFAPIVPQSRRAKYPWPGINPALPVGMWHPSLGQPSLLGHQAMANLQAGHMPLNHLF